MGGLAEADLGYSRVQRGSICAVVGDVASSQVSIWVTCHGLSVIASCTPTHQWQTRGLTRIVPDATVGSARFSDDIALV